MYLSLLFLNMSQSEMSGVGSGFGWLGFFSFWFFYEEGGKRTDGIYASQTLLKCRVIYEGLICFPVTWVVCLCNFTRFKGNRMQVSRVLTL